MGRHALSTWLGGWRPTADLKDYAGSIPYSMSAQPLSPAYWHSMLGQPGLLAQNVGTVCQHGSKAQHRTACHLYTLAACKHSRAGRHSTAYQLSTACKHSRAGRHSLLE
eukprot:GHUV01019192.1.p1 GENE.GHUV01019192.1~~GHUV01019192.1.p1  ORF type:complete len:109 (+),score=21.87 GHUV01019192.1:1667-1993(+)